jgi:uncharacterized protein RhaS with RHS repeats
MTRVSPVYNYFRDYDPSTGGFIESDPIGLEAGINTYNYANADPVLRVDPTGQDAIALPLNPAPTVLPGWVGQSQKAPGRPAPLRALGG